MRKFWEGQSCVLYHIDRIESRYGNICIRGWVSDLDPEERTECSVVDADGVTLPVYMERLVREDVNAAVHKPVGYESGIHILIDRAALNTPYVWLTFTNGAKRRRSFRILVQTSGLKRAWKLRRAKKDVKQMCVQPTHPEELDYDLWIRTEDAGCAGKKSTERGGLFPLGAFFGCHSALQYAAAIFKGSH